MLTRQSRTLRKIQASRCIRSAYKNVKKKFSKGNAGTPSSLIGETILPTVRGNREKKYKSTLAVAVASVAIGVSHVAAVSGKYSIKVSGRNTLCIGLAVGAITSAIWYKYIDAAYDGVTEDDISMMFEMANSTGYGSLDDDDESAKAVDILHTIVTGKVSDVGNKSDSMFKYDDDDEDADVDDEGDTDSSMFGKTVSFSDNSISKSSTNSKSIGIGKSLKKGRGLSRKSFLPDLDRQEAESDKEDAEDGWMDFT